MLLGSLVLLSAIAVAVSQVEFRGSKASAAALPAAPAAVAPAASGTGTTTAAVAGFRSAQFGMTEDQVRAAIEKDFGARGDAIRSETNAAEQTRVLAVLVPDLLQGGGRAQVSYVFGYKTKSLIQVGVTWSKATDDSITPERLFSDGNILQAHFIASHYLPQSVATNGVVAQGLLLFRGADAAGHTTALLLLGTFQNEANKQRVLTPTALSLLYVADPRNPDIYRLPEGSF